MAKLTLLEIVEDVLNDLDSDPVDSIDDTVESSQVAQIAKTCYYTLVNDRDWPWLRQLSAFNGLGDTNNPTKMRMPEGMGKVLWVKYNKKDVQYISPKEFKDIIDARVTQANVVNSSGYVLNRDPIYWTTYDDDYVWFDGYDTDEDSTLQTSKCVVYAQMAPTWTVSDSFVPNLPEKMFPMYVSEVKSSAFLVLKQQANAKEEAKARRGMLKFQKEAARINDAETLTNQPDYGRK